MLPTLDLSPTPAHGHFSFWRSKCYDKTNQGKFNKNLFPFSKKKIIDEFRVGSANSILQMAHVHLKLDEYMWIPSGKQQEDNLHV
jgi:hypothetical protein